MKKSRLPKVSEPRYFISSDRKLRKKAANPNLITAKRVTLLPGFLRHGVRSETVHKTAEKHYDDEVLNENLHGLLGKPRRRSARLSSKTASAYFQEVISSPIVDRSKSIFREIKEKYAQKVEQDANHDFGARLFASLGTAFRLRDLEQLKEEIRDEIVVINNILAGKVDPGKMASTNNRKRAYCGEEDKENYPPKFSFVPSSNWVYQTPPNRKLNYNQAKVDETCIQPAVLETRNDAKVVYEVNNKINVDFSRCFNHQEVNIDKRYMVEVSSVEEDFTFQLHGEDDDGKKFQFQSDPYELENHFLSLTCRPKKAPCTVSRIASMKRKRDIFEPRAPEPGCSTSETVNEFDSSFTFINNSLNTLEESFTFKFTANDGATTGHIFDFDGNKKDTFNFQY